MAVLPHTSRKPPFVSRKLFAHPARPVKEGTDEYLQIWSALEKRQVRWLTFEYALWRDDDEDDEQDPLETDECPDGRFALGGQPKVALYEVVVSLAEALHCRAHRALYAVLDARYELRQAVTCCAIRTAIVVDEAAPHHGTSKLADRRVTGETWIAHQSSCCSYCWP